MCVTVNEPSLVFEQVPWPLLGCARLHASFSCPSGRARFVARELPGARADTATSAPGPFREAGHARARRTRHGLPAGKAGSTGLELEVRAGGHAARQRLAGACPGLYPTLGRRSHGRHPRGQGEALLHLDPSRSRSPVAIAFFRSSAPASSSIMRTTRSTTGPTRATTTTPGRRHHGVARASDVAALALTFATTSPRCTPAFTRGWSSASATRRTQRATLTAGHNRRRGSPCRSTTTSRSKAWSPTGDSVSTFASRRSSPSAPCSGTSACSQVSGCVDGEPQTDPQYPMSPVPVKNTCGAPVQANPYGVAFFGIFAKVTLFGPTLR